MIFSEKSTLKFVQEYKGKTVLLATCEAWSKNKKLKKGAYFHQVERQWKQGK